MKKKIFKWLKWITVAYIVIGLLLFLFQDFFLFHPAALSRNYRFQFDVPFKEVEIGFGDDTLNMIQFLPKDPVRKGVVIYFHGNKQNINRYAKFADNFTKHGYEVWMEDYPGFGKSTGSRSEQYLYDQAMSIYKLAASKYRSDSIIIFGKSFGTGIASYVAANTNCKRLILETPYYSVPALFSCYLPVYPTALLARYKLPVNEYLKKVNYPITIFHGDDDGVIPYRCAARLKLVIKPSDEFITIPKGTHHNLNDFTLFHQKLDSLLLR